MFMSQRVLKLEVPKICLPTLEMVYMYYSKSSKRFFIFDGFYTLEIFGKPGGTLLNEFMEGQTIGMLVSVN